MSVLDDLVPSPAWIVRPILAIVSTQMRFHRIKSFLESNGKALLSKCERMNADVVSSSKSRGVFFYGC